MTRLLAGSRCEQRKKREQLCHTHLFLSLFASDFFWEDVTNSTELCTLCQLQASFSPGGRKIDVKPAPTKACAQPNIRSVSATMAATPERMYAGWQATKLNCYWTDGESFRTMLRCIPTKDERRKMVRACGLVLRSSSFILCRDGCSGCHTVYRFTKEVP